MRSKFKDTHYMQTMHQSLLKVITNACVDFNLNKLIQVIQQVLPLIV